MQVPKWCIWCVLWAGIFALGLAAGFVFYKPLWSPMSPLIRTGLDAVAHMATLGAATTALIVFAKNSSVALMCALLGRQTCGSVPLIVCAVNGIVIGFMAAVASRAVAPWKFFLVLAPHGVIELPAIFLACAIGMVAPLEVGERLRLVRVPLALLVGAAVIEVWVSPLVAARLLT